MGFLKDHPHTAITDAINKTITDPETLIEVELPTILRLIPDQYTGNIEAARAIRKHLKYGTTPEQRRALEMMNLIVANVPAKQYQEFLNDKKLFEVLRNKCIGTNSSGKASKIRGNAISVVLGWYARTEGNSNYTTINDLAQTIVKLRAEARKQKKVGKKDRRFMEDTANNNISVDFNKSECKTLIADALSVATQLQNALLVLPRGRHSLDDEDATELFIEARETRRKVLRYLQVVQDGEYLSSLIKANEELVEALQRYDTLAGDVEDESESEFSMSESEEDDVRDDNDPFGDQNRI